ncbi:MAG: TrkH family potassium uptake protein [Planctomycetota bacterium]
MAARNRNSKRRITPRETVGPPRSTTRLLDILLAIAGLVAVAALALEHGFVQGRPTWATLTTLRTVQIVIVGVFILDRMLRLVLAASKTRYLAENWVDYVIIGAFVVLLTVSARLKPSVVSAGALYVIVAQGYLLVSLLLRGVSVHLRFAGSGVHPLWLLVGSFAAMCLIGSMLLMLPAATPDDKPIEYVDALFTATSATCVTGLIVRDTGSDFTYFGQAVILVLIQLGGLGIMIFGTVLAMLVGRGLSIRGTQAVGEIMSAEAVGRIGRTVTFVVLLTFVLEVAGAGLLYPMTSAPQGAAGEVPRGEAVWLSVFHSVSSFCNAGFSLYDGNMMEGVRGQTPWAKPLREHWQVLGVMAPLIVLGGLGFPVLQDLARYARALLKRAVHRLRTPTLERLSGSPRAQLSLHSKIVLSATVLLIPLGAAGLLLVEPPPRPADAETRAIGRNPISRRGDSDWKTLNDARRIRAAVFHSVSARTAGFNTVDMDELSDAGKLWMCGLMVIGGSPASTAGGMKTVAFVLLLVTAWCVLTRKQEVQLYRRSIAYELLRKTVTLAVLYLGLVLTVTLLLSVALRHGTPFIDLLFEACSACGTVGLSTGVTRSLNTFSKLVIIAAMFMGRLGPLTLLLALTSRLRPPRYEYPLENVVIG